MPERVYAKSLEGTNVDFCRVLEIPPTKYVGSHPFCHGGGWQYPVKIVDWFHPLSGIEKDIGEAELIKMLTEFLEIKEYIRPEYYYICICDFGLIFQIDSELVKTFRKNIGDPILYSQLEK